MLCTRYLLFGYFVDCVWPVPNFLLNSVYYGRSWKDKYGKIYISEGKSSGTFETWISRYFFWVMVILSKFVKFQNHFVCELYQIQLYKYIFSKRSFKDLFNNICICKEKPSRTFEFWILVFSWAQITFFLSTFADIQWSRQNFLLN